MPTKFDLSKKILKEINPDASPKEVELVSKRFWINSVAENKKFRLSDTGYNLMELAKIEGWNYYLTDHLTTGLLLLLSDRLMCPYYILYGKKIYVKIYDGKIATMISLHSDFLAYLKR